MAGSLAYEAHSADEARDYVAKIAAEKPDIIKLMITGGVLDAKKAPSAQDWFREEFDLSERETEVALLIAQGRSKAYIADALCLSENTVRTHSKRIYVKLDIHKRQELIALVESFEPEGR